MADHKPKLCVVTTGGTIGMVRDAEGVARPPAHPTEFLASIPELGERFDLDVVGLLNKDSADITPADWTLLAETVAARATMDYRGIVVVHGTDTMAYTASAVALAMGPPPLPLPVVFTGAMRTADDPEPDGSRNLADACQMATGHIGEVLIVFGGMILRGCRASKRYADRLDAFVSPSFPAYGQVMHGGMATNMCEPCRSDFSHRREPRTGFATGVLPITLTPGMSTQPFRSVLEAGGLSGVVLQGLGDANLPTAEPNGWSDFIRGATRRDVPVLLTSPLVGESAARTVYAGGRAALDAGAMGGGNLTFECAVAKLSWAIAQARVDGGAVVPRVREIMQHVYVGEMDAPDATLSA